MVLFTYRLIVALCYAFYGTLTLRESSSKQWVKRGVMRECEGQPYQQQVPFDCEHPYVC